MAKLLLGKEVTDALNEKLMERTAALKEQGIIPTLAIIRCGANPSDLSYEKGATKRAELVGVAVKKYELPEDVTKEAPSPAQASEGRPGRNLQPSGSQEGCGLHDRSEQCRCV